MKTAWKAIMIMPVIRCKQCRPAPTRGWVKRREFGAVWIKLRGMWGKICLLILTLRRLEAIMLFVIQCEQWWTAPRRDWGESKDRSVVVSSNRPTFSSNLHPIALTFFFSSRFSMSSTTTSSSSWGLALMARYWRGFQLQQLRLSFSIYKYTLFKNIWVRKNWLSEIIFWQASPPPRPGKLGCSSKTASRGSHQ